MLRAAIYTRVSTATKSKQGDAVNFVQNLEVQEQPLRDLIAQRDWRFIRGYSDRASGAKERRPGLDALLADARRGLFDVLVVWRFDRFARSVKQLVFGLEEFRVMGIEFVSHQEALDTSTPMGKAMFTIIAAMAELSAASSGSVWPPEWSTHAETEPGQANRLAGRRPSFARTSSRNFARKVCLGEKLHVSWALALLPFGEHTRRRATISATQR
jgi:hypothetical protein